MIGGSDEIEPQLLEAALQGLAASGVARPGAVEALLEHRTQPGVESEHHRHRSRVVIRATARAFDVAGDQPEVEVPRGRPFLQAGPSACAHRKGRQARRYPETFLGPAVGQINAPPVCIERDTPERGDGVHEEQGVAFAPRHLFDVVAHTGRGLGMNERDHRRRPVGSEQGVGVERLAPGRIHPHHLGAQALGYVAHALPEQAVDADDYDITRSGHVDERRLHACRSRPAHGQGQGVVGLEDSTEPITGLVEDGQELRVQVAEERAREGRHDLGIEIGGSGPHQDAVAEHHPRMLGRSAVPPANLG